MTIFVASLERIARHAVVLAEPVGLLWCALLAWTAARLCQRRWRSAAASALLAGFIQLIGGSGFPDWLLRSLEARYAAVKIADLPVCDAIVQLGGSSEPSHREAGGVRLGFAGDRIAMALELARLGKAPVLCVSGGLASATSTVGHEADVVKAAIVERGLTGAEVISLGGSLDTRDEAVRVQRLAAERGWQRILLVTSAAHLPRATATFRQVGLGVVPAPCNFLTDLDEPASPASLRLPTWHGFFRTSVWMHETIGWLEYRRRGWLAPP